MRFEHLPSRIVFDPGSGCFVVTWTKNNVPAESRLSEAKDVRSFMPSVYAIASLYERGCVCGGEIRAAASSIGRAYDAGDRHMLDTSSAKEAAETIRDLSLMNSGTSDIRQAMRSLLDEIARSRFASEPVEKFGDSAIEPLSRAWIECSTKEGFHSWSRNSMRRRFLYCLRRKERTPVAYTIAGLLFDCGSCPLLPISDRRVLRMNAADAALRESGNPDGDVLSDGVAVSFMSHCLREMAAARSAGMSGVGSRITQQQMADSVLLSKNDKS